jgi:hypothetical protein
VQTIEGLHPFRLFGDHARDDNRPEGTGSLTTR